MQLYMQKSVNRTAQSVIQKHLLCLCYVQAPYFKPILTFSDLTTNTKGKKLFEFDFLAFCLCCEILRDNKLDLAQGLVSYDQHSCENKYLLCYTHGIITYE